MWWYCATTLARHFPLTTLSSRRTGLTVPASPIRPDQICTARRLGRPPYVTLRWMPARAAADRKAPIEEPPQPRQVRCGLDVWCARRPACHPRAVVPPQLVRCPFPVSTHAPVCPLVRSALGWPLVRFDRPSCAHAAWHGMAWLDGSLDAAAPTRTVFRVDRDKKMG